MKQTERIASGSRIREIRTYGSMRGMEGERSLALRLSIRALRPTPPPSTEGLNKKSRGQRTTSLRSSNKTFGGQVGHKGKTLGQEEDPDEIKRYEVTRCHQCEADLTNVNPESIIKRQVVDVEIKRTVTEYQAEMK